MIERSKFHLPLSRGSLVTADFGVARVLHRESVAKSFCGKKSCILYEKTLSCSSPLPPPSLRPQALLPTWPQSCFSATWPEAVTPQAMLGELLCMWCCYTLSMVHACTCGSGQVTCCLCGWSGCRYDDKCDVWSIGCILWDMANSANLFVFVSLVSSSRSIEASYLPLPPPLPSSQELSNNPGLNLAKASPSIGAKEIQDLIDKDIPDVSMEIRC